MADKPVVLEETIESKKLVLTQANALVRCFQEMSLQEKKLLMLVISLVRKDDKNFKTHFIPISEIADYLNVGSDQNLYTRLPKITKKLLSRVIHLDLEGDNWSQFQWVSKADFISAKNSYNGKTGIRIRLHDDLVPLLLELKKHFGSIPLKQLTHLPSFYSIRILEILWYETYGGKKSNVNFELRDLKMRLGVLKLDFQGNVEEEKYKVFKDFKKRVLEKARKDCEENGILAFNYKTIKAGKKIVGIEFTVWKNSNFEGDFNLPQKLTTYVETPSKPDIPSHYEDFIDELGKMGYLGNGLKLIEDIGEEAVKDLLKLANRQEKLSKGTSKEIRNMGGLINWLVKTEAWKAEAIRREATKEAERKAVEAQVKAKQSKDVAELISSINDDYNKACLDYNNNYWRTLSKQKKEQVKTEIKLNCQELILQMLDKDNWKEDSFVFILERDAALERLGLEPNFPENLQNKENYLHSEKKYKNIAPEVIKEVIANFEK